MSKVKINLDLITNVKVYKNKKLVRKCKNKVVDTGLNHVVSRLVGDTLTPMTHMAIGLIDTPVELTDVELFDQLGDRVGLTSVTIQDNVVEFSCTFEGVTHNGSIKEAGIFNAAATGIMLNRVVFPVVNIQEADTLTIVWTLTFANKVI